MLTFDDLLGIPSYEWNFRRKEGEKVESLVGKNLWGADLRGCDLHGLDMTLARLQGAMMQDANLEGTSLYYANLCEANLIRATLRNVDMQRANMQCANLCGADLTDANLTDANIRGANLAKARLVRVNGLPDVRQILANIPRNRKGEYVLCKVFLRTKDDQWVEPSGDLADVTEGTRVEMMDVDLSPTDDCGEGLYVATKEWCKKEYAGLHSFAPFEVYTDWVFVPLVGGGKFRIGPQLAETCDGL